MKGVPPAAPHLEAAASVMRAPAAGPPLGGPAAEPAAVRAGADGANAERTEARAELPGIPAPLAALLDGLEALDRSARMEQLVAWADEFAEVPPAVARRPFPEASRAPRCESDAHVFAVDRADGTLSFHFAVENPHGISARAWAVLLARTCSGQPLEQVASVPEETLFQVFGRELSMGKGQGLIGMLELVRHAARVRLAAREAAASLQPSSPS
jgi:cysteine desulfuration protein SufE